MSVIVPLHICKSLSNLKTSITQLFLKLQPRNNASLNSDLHSKIVLMWHKKLLRTSVNSLPTNTNCCKCFYSPSVFNTFLFPLALQRRKIKFLTFQEKKAKLHMPTPVSPQQTNMIYHYTYFFSFRINLSLVFLSSFSLKSHTINYSCSFYIFNLIFLTGYLLLLCFS